VKKEKTVPETRLGKRKKENGGKLSIPLAMGTIKLLKGKGAVCLFFF